MKFTCPLNVEQNEGSLDRIIRIVIGSLAGVLGMFWLSDTAQLVAYVVGVVGIGTGLWGFCGLYTLLGISTCSTKKVKTGLLVAVALLIVGTGAVASNFITKKKFLEDFNQMNGYYKQALFLTGQSKREEAKVQYDLLVDNYNKFSQKYTSYRPMVIRQDKQFGDDLQVVQNLITAAKDGVYSGDLLTTHKELEEIRPIFQTMFKRNGFSMLSMALVDFHDIMEQIITASDDKNTTQVLEVYPKVDLALQAVEKEENSVEIQAIRQNLNELKALAEGGKAEELKSKAAMLKASFIKVYLVKG